MEQTMRAALTSKKEKVLTYQKKENRNSSTSSLAAMISKEMELI
ncbi:hypothetical protein [Butyrivibrio sp. TB]|nr:hypothetical protein [Butyrivibrio sp. TB]